MRLMLVVAAPGSFGERVKQGWSAFSVSVIDPWQTILLPVLAVVLVLLVAARLLTSRVVPGSTPAVPASRRRTAGGAGTALVLAAAAVVPIWAIAQEGGGRALAWALFGVMGAVLILVGMVCASPSERSVDDHEQKPADDGARQATTGRHGRLMVASWQVALVFLAVTTLFAALLVGLADLDLGVPDGLPWLLSAVLGAGGVLILAAAQGQQLRVQLAVNDVKGAADSNSTACLTGQLYRLGSEGPRGFRVAAGTDVTALPDDALTSLPEGKLAVAAITALRAFLPVVPWRATVSLMDDSTADLAITRNRARMDDDSRLIRRSDLGLPPLENDASEHDKSVAREELLVAAAAAILLALKKGHPDLAYGLCGASDYRAVALQYIASTMPRGAPSKRRDLLYRAVALDPHNDLARLSWLSDEVPLPPRTWEHVAQALDLMDKGLVTRGKIAGPPTAGKAAGGGQVDVATEAGGTDKEKGYEALGMRLAYNRTVAWLNACTHQRGCTELKHVTRALGDLRKRLVDREKKAPILARQLTANLPYLEANLAVLRKPPQAPSEELMASGYLTGKAAYGRACVVASSFALHKSLTGREWGQLWDDLGLAFAEEPSLREWARSDPALNGLWAIRRQHGSFDRGKEFRALAGTPAPTGEFLDLPPLADHRDALEKMGVTRAQDVVATSPASLAEGMKVPLALVKRWRDVARLQLYPLGMDDPERRLTVEEVGFLWWKDVRSPADFRACINGREFDDGELATTARGFGFVPHSVRVDCWRAWVESGKIRPTPPARWRTR